MLPMALQEFTTQPWTAAVCSNRPRAMRFVKALDSEYGTGDHRGTHQQRSEWMKLPENEELGDDVQDDSDRD